MIIERIKHATEKDLEVLIEKTNYRTFHVYFRDTEVEIISDLKIFNSEECAKHYAERLAGLLDA